MPKEPSKKPWPLIAVIFLGVLLVALGAYMFRPSARMNSQKPESAAPSSGQTAPASVSVLVLNYHKVDHTFHSLAVPPENFRWQMQYLKNHGYQTITPDELMQALEGKGNLPRNPVLITFDDGYLDNYENAYPVLKELGMKATVFVVTDFMAGKKGYMNWAQCREMEKNGITVESHTVTHRSMTDLSDEDLRRELRGSKERAEEALGHPVDYIAYPTGTYNLHIADLAREAGYKAAFTIKYGDVDDASNVYALERVPIFHTVHTNRDFVERINYTPLFQQFGWAKH